LSISDRLKKLEKKLALPGPAPVVIIDEGDSVPVGAQVVIVDDITERMISLAKE